MSATIAVGTAPRGRSENMTTWITVMAGVIGAFMAVLNIQITNASLLDIEGGIGTGADNGAWISTAYLIGEIIVIPLTDYLSRVFSFRRFLLTNAALFLVFSVACAFAHSLQEMIVLRAIQGFTGGVLIPMAFTLILTKLTQAQRPIGMALFAITATVAPAIGPTIGGYLTENYGWQYIFFINLVPGAVMLGVLYATLEKQPMQLSLLRHGDWFGIITMAIGLGALQTVLEEGNLHDWFGSAYITRLAIIAAVFLSLFIWIELTVREPAVNLRLLTRRNFSLGTGANMLLGFALYGSVFLLPEYLGQAQGYNSEQIGAVMAWTGLPQLIIIPFVPLLMRQVDTRWIVVLGLSVFGGSFLMNVHMSADYAGDQFWLPNVTRAAGQALVMGPMTTIAMYGIAQFESPAASGIFNMLRNLGGAIGTALLGTLVTKREQYHSNIIGSSVNLYSEAVRERLAMMTQYFQSRGVSDPAAAYHQAVIALGNTVRRQALIMGYSDAFALLGIMLALAATLILFTRKGQASGAPAH
jgi:DHA2 family multidrug resistance protein